MLLRSVGVGRSHRQPVGLVMEGRDDLSSLAVGYRRPHRSAHGLSLLSPCRNRDPCRRAHCLLSLFELLSLITFGHLASSLLMLVLRIGRLSIPRRAVVNTPGVAADLTLTHEAPGCGL